MHRRALHSKSSHRFANTIYLPGFPFDSLPVSLTPTVSFTPTPFCFTHSARKETLKMYCLRCQAPISLFFSFYQLMKRRWRCTALRAKHRFATFATALASTSPTTSQNSKAFTRIKEWVLILRFIKQRTLHWKSLKDGSHGGKFSTKYSIAV